MTPSATPDVNHPRINTQQSEAKTLSKTRRKPPKIQLRESERSRGSADTSTYGDTDKNRGRDEAPAKYKHHACRVAANSSHTPAPPRPRSLSLVHAVVCTLQWPGPPHSPHTEEVKGAKLGGTQPCLGLEKKKKKHVILG